MKRNLSLGISIVLIGAIIAGGIFVSRKKPGLDLEINFDDFFQNDIVEINPINNQDYILGSPNAKIIIIEYTHLECTYTQHFHETMMKVIKEYGPRGEVAWIIRHFPVPELYPNSYKAAIATECVTNINKENRGIFWKYLEDLYAITPTEISSEKLRESAINVGTDPDLYDSCVITEKYDSKIKADIADAKKLVEIEDVFMTPYNLIITRTGLQTRISGSLDFFDLRSMIDQMLVTID